MNEEIGIKIMEFNKEDQTIEILGHKIDKSYESWEAFLEEMKRLTLIQNNWNELKESIEEILNMVSTIEHNLEKYEEVGLDHFDYALEKTRELKSYVIEILEGNND